MLATQKSPTLQAIANSIAVLTLTDQLWLLEHIAHQIRQQNELAAMAQDPHIQAEIAQIQEEFAVTELDGLVEL
ncbi:MAG: hypothetical protein DCE90_14475 [Pseudanabaena sp.]|nr:MAG: hypothetical protein DCE90_14475 [Pseudanabaena sp.]